MTDKSSPVSVEDCTTKHEKILKKMDEIKTDINIGNTTFAILEWRLKLVEKIVYGAATLSLIAVLGVVLSPITKGDGDKLQIDKLYKQLEKIEKNTSRLKP